MAPRLREADLAEAEAVGLSARSLLLESVQVTPQPWAVVYRGRPVFLFGCAPQGVEFTSDVHGIVWGLGSNEVTEFPRTFLRESRGWLERITAGCKSSGNVVDSRNTVHVKWLRWLGYEIIEEYRVGPTTFLRFSKAHVLRSDRSRRRHRGDPGVSVPPGEEAARPG